MKLRFNFFDRLKDLIKSSLNYCLKRIANIKKSLIQKGLSKERDFDKSTFKEINGNAHLFIQDISQHKMPYSRRLGNYTNFKVTITGTDIDKAKLILNNLSKHSHNHSDTDLVSDIINNLSEKVYYWGKIHYLKNSESNEPACTEIWPLGVFRFFTHYLQVVPKNKSLAISPYLRFEKATNVFTFSLFNNLFHKISFFLIEQMLNRDRKGFPTFYVEDKFRNRNFDLKYYKKIETVFLALITKRYAWKLRYLADDYKNEYFRFYCSYMTAIKNAEDRESILDQINKMLKQFNVDAVVMIEGIPSSHDLKKSFQEMAEGKRSFTEALKDIYLT